MKGLFIPGITAEMFRNGSFESIEELMAEGKFYDIDHPTEERKTGKWIEKDGWDGDVYYDCSVCGESWTTIEGTPWDNFMNYCPHCGAKMEGAAEK